MLLSIRTHRQGKELDHTCSYFPLWLLIKQPANHLLIHLCLLPTSVRDRLVIPEWKLNMTSLRGQASWAKMVSLRGKLTALILGEMVNLRKVN
jgi:hypothetical protein